MRKQIKEFLDSNESAPSALVLVLSATREVGDEEIAQIYEQSEGFNDSQRNNLIDSMTSEELLKVAEDCLCIANERLAEFQE